MNDSSLCNDTGLVSVAPNVTMRALGNQCVQDFMLQFLYDFLQMFYIVFPSEDLKENDPEVPNYEINVSQSFGWNDCFNSCPFILAHSNG